MRHAELKNDPTGFQSRVVRDLVTAFRLQIGARLSDGSLRDTAPRKRTPPRAVSASNDLLNNIGFSWSHSTLPPAVMEAMYCTPWVGDTTTLPLISTAKATRHAMGKGRWAANLYALPLGGACALHGWATSSKRMMIFGSKWPQNGYTRGWLCPCVALDVYLANRANFAGPANGPMVDVATWLRSSR